MSTTLKRLKELVEYNATTGVFVWKQSVGAAKEGSVAGSYHKASGYTYIRMEGCRYLAHRLAWFYCNGAWPAQIDHINGDRSDNRIGNLREISAQGNMQNIGGAKKHNKLGVLGVSYIARLGLYRADIRHNRKSIHIGCFTSPEAAHAAYLRAKQELHLSSARLPKSGDFPIQTV